MALTNFNTLLTEQKKVWSRDVWKVARENSFVMQFTGTGPNSMIQRITELTKTERGDKAIITLVPDLEGDGIVGDNQLDGNEEELKAYDKTIQIDQLRNATTHKGRMAQQKTVVNFREQSRDVLGYWLADRIDQLAFLTMSGLAYTLNLDGTTRSTNSQLSQLSFASDVAAPSAGRNYRWDVANGLQTDGTAALVAGDTPSYQMLVETKAQMKTKYIRGVKTGGGQEIYHVFMHPLGLAQLKLESDFKNAINYAGVRGNKNPFFTGAIVTVDGLVIHEYRHVYRDSTWGGGSLNGQRVIFAGAQAMAMCDLGDPNWEEEGKDYQNRQGIAVDKIFGMLKPQFKSNHTAGVEEDFGLLTVDTALDPA